jgi:ribosome-associated heat shock protein Hsp15
MTDKAAAGMAPSQRLDQWLCFARLTKSRTLAQALIERGKVRINRDKATRASQMLKTGDVVTLSVGPRVRVFEIKGIGVRRGPAAEAQALYQELTPAPDRTKSSPAEKLSAEATAGGNSTAAVRPAGAGRPTKRDRRATERLKDRLREL